MEEQRARALLAGTLALMTSFAESRCPFASARICTNLLELSAMGAMPWEFRVVLAKLGARWAQLQEPSTDPEDRGAVRH